MSLVVNDRYRLHQLLGGGMGRVYRAEDLLAPGLLITFKTLAPGADIQQGSRQLSREFLVLADLAHPHLVQVHDFDHVRHVVGEASRDEPLEPPSNGMPFFIRDYVPGELLMDAVPKLSPEGVTRVLVQLAGTLAYLHRQGLLHRDLKPDNVLVVESEVGGQLPRAKVLDFGLAMFEGEATRAAGHVRYLAPEVLHGSLQDARAEVYSLGLIFYEVLSGSPPFDGDSAAELARAHAKSDVPPLPEDVPERLRAMVRRMLAKRPEQRPALTEIIDAVEPSSGEQMTRAAWGHLGAPRLSGRAQTLALFDRLSNELLENDEQAQEPPPSTLVITGSPGIGKSRLIQALRHRAQVAGLRFLYSRCPQNADAFSAGRALLRPLIQERPDFITPEREVLRMVLSDRTLARSEHQSTNLTPRRAMVRIFDAARTLLEAAAQEQRLVLVMEDLHWADPESLELFRHLQRNLVRGSALLVGTSWPPGQAMAPLEELLAELPLASGEAVWHELEGLSDEEVHLMLQRSIDLPSTEHRLASQLREGTDGNPLFIEEILKVTHSTEALSSLLTHHHLPKAVGESFRAQLLSLGAGAITALAGLSVWNEAASSITVSQITGQDRIGCLDGLEEAAHCQLIREQQGGYWFWHNVLVQVLDDMMSDDDRIMFHLRAGFLREGVGESRDLERIGRLVTHFSIAGEPAKALGYALSGARLAEKQFMSRQAIEMYERARDLGLEVIGHSFGGTAGLIEVRERLAHLYAWTGSYDPAEMEAQALLDDPGVRRDPSARTRVRALLGDIATRRGDLDGALAYFETALESCTVPDEAVDVLTRTADVHFRQGDVDETERDCARALARLGDAPAPARRAAIAYHLGKCAQQKTDYALALARFTRARELHQRARYRPGIAMSINAIAQVYHYQNQYAHAREAFLDALELLEQLGDVESVANTLERLALTTWGLLDINVAITYCERSLREWRRLGNAQGEARTLTTLGLIHHSRGAYGEALECSEASIKLQRGSDDQSGLLVSYQNLGILYYEVGALEEARAAAERALEIAGQFESKLRTTRCYHILGLIASVQGEPEVAGRYLDIALQMTRETGNRERLSDVLCTAAESELRLGHLEQARRYVDEAVSLTESLGRNLYRTQAHMTDAFVVLSEPNADLRKVLERLEDVVLPGSEQTSPDLMWQLWALRGRIGLALGRPREACRNLTRSMEVIQSCYRLLPAHLKPIYLSDERRKAVRCALERAIQVAQADERPRPTTPPNLVTLEGDRNDAN